MSAPVIDPSIFAGNKLYNFPKQYLWRALDFTNQQNYVYNTIGALTAGAFGASVLNGYAVTIGSGMILNVGAGIGVNVNGQAAILGTATTCPVLTPVGNPAATLIVARIVSTPSDYITDPTNPTGPTIPLDNALTVSIVVLNGTPAGSPVYPTPLSTDIVIMGLQIPANTTTLTSGMFDTSQIYLPSDSFGNISCVSVTATGPVNAEYFRPSPASLPATVGNGMYLAATNTLAFATNGTFAAQISSTQNWTMAGAVTAAVFIPSSSSVPTNGMYLLAANNVGFSANSTNILQLNTSQFGVNIDTMVIGLSTTAGAQIRHQSGIFTASVSICGGGGASAGGKATFYGSTHASFADQIVFSNSTLTSGSIAADGHWNIGSGNTNNHALNTLTYSNGSGVGTFTNLPSGKSGNPTGYIEIVINGTQSAIPFW